MQGESKMGQWLIDVGADKALGVLIIVLSFYFGLKMFFMSRGPVEGVGVDNPKSLKTKKKTD